MSRDVDDSRLKLIMVDADMVHHLNVVGVVCFGKKALDTIFNHVFFFLKYKEKSTGHTAGT